MNIKYPQMRYYFSTLLANDSGLSSDQVHSTIKNALLLPEQKRRLESELPLILSDAEIDWQEWMCNEEYEIDDDPESYDEFRELIVTYFWRAVFPQRNPPKCQ